MNRNNLRQIYNSVVIKNTLKNLELLKKLEGQVVYGSANKKLVAALLQKRGFFGPTESEEGQESKLAKPIQIDNNLVEERFGDKYGMLCVDDLVDVLTNTENEEFLDEETPEDKSAAFEATKQHLWCFRLSPNDEIKERFIAARKPKWKGGDLGYYEDAEEFETLINALM